MKHQFLFENFGEVLTLGRFRELTKELPDETSFEFRHQPAQHFVKITNETGQIIGFQEKPKSKRR